ncbi:conserved hypothetical protein (fragment) [Streptomyces scabiei 87.22]|uniref:Uncharacterized protein n=1 Tax=Streptomyces scabiei (strain 87.22) TaxID=680198 RepID=C9ZAD5_STRSW
MERARTVRGCVRVLLSTQRSVHAARRIHERLGFTRAPA